MAFDPRSDVVLEVLRAADPAREAAATQRLTALAGSADPAAPSFADALSATAPALASRSEGANARARLEAVAQGPDKAARANVEFEAMLLGSLMNEMLPKDAGTVFGQGFAGEMWRSMLADQAARQIARSGALGIGKRLFATHPLAAGRAPAAPRTVAASANALSLPAGAEVTGGAVLFRSARSS